MTSIDKNVPLPVEGSKGNSAGAVLDSMEIGDSIVVDDIAYKAMRFRSYRTSRTITRRATGDGLYRVWRTA